MFVCVPVRTVRSSQLCKVQRHPPPRRQQGAGSLASRSRARTSRFSSPRGAALLLFLLDTIFILNKGVCIRPSTSVLLLGPPERTSKIDPPPGQRPARSALQRQRTGHSHSAQATQARSGRVTAHHRARPGSGVSPVPSEGAAKIKVIEIVKSKR
jgi:hypothetical protein